MPPAIPMARLGYLLIMVRVSSLFIEQSTDTPMPINQATVQETRVTGPFALLRTILLVLVLQKEIGPRLFLPQAGEIYSPSRIVYYFEFFLALSVITIALFHFARIARYFIRYPEFFIYLIFVCYVGTINEESALTGFQKVSLFVEPVIIITLFSLYNGIDSFKKILLYFSCFIIITNAAAAIYPSMSFAQGGELPGTYRGLTLHRGDLAFTLTVTMSIVICYMRPSILKYLLIFLAIAMLIGTGSAQGPILLIFGIILLPLIRSGAMISSVRGILVVAISAIMAAIYIVYPEITDELFGLFGRDMTFTGRDRIWSLALYMIERQPLLGYGIQQFSNTNLPNSLLHSFRIGTTFGTTHSSYIEAVYSFGYIGGGLFILVVLRHLYAWISGIFSLRTIVDSLPYILTVYCVVGGFTAAEKLFLPGAGWLTFVIAKILLDAERQRSTIWNPVVARLPAVPIFAKADRQQD